MTSTQATIDCYNENADEYRDRFLTMKTADFCQKFLSYLPKNAHILDAGCGPGRDTKYFLDHGYKVTAFDGAEELVKRAETYTNHPILHLSFHDITFQEEFDGVWAMASLLHLSEADCQDVLAHNLLPALKPSGVLFCCFLEGDGERISKGRYFKDYTEDALRNLFAQFPDLSILHIWKEEDHAPDRKGRNWVYGIVRKEASVL